MPTLSAPPYASPYTSSPYAPSYAPPSYEQQFVQSLRTPDPADASVSDDTGDIILNADAAPKSSKTGLIVGLSLAGLALIAIIAIVVVALTSNRSDSATPAPVAGPLSADVKSEFYRYANDVIYGTDSADPPAEEPSSYYYSQFLYNGPDSDQAYFDRIYEKYTTFYDHFQAADPQSTAAAQAHVTDYKHLLDFLKVNPAGEDFSRDHIISVYLASGEEAAIAAADEALARLPSPSYAENEDPPDDYNSYSSTFYELKDQDFSATIGYLSMMDTSGCLMDNGTIDEQCANGVNTTTDTGESLTELMSQYRTEASSFVFSAYDAIGQKCWQIKDILENEQS